MESPDPTAWLARLAEAPLLVVGDLMLDRFVHGTVERISPEGPIPVLSVAREAAMLGGAGNVLRNLAALGIPAQLLALAGDDEDATRLRTLIADEGLDAELVCEAGRATTVKTRYLAGGQHLLRADRETSRPAAAQSRAALLDKADAAFGQVKGLVLSDYGKGVLEPGLLGSLIARARGAGLPVVVDPKGPDFQRYRGATVITPNQRELGEALGRRLESDDELLAGARDLLESLDLSALLVTRGAKGMTLIAREIGGGLSDRRLPAQAREVYDVSGAGDTVAAVVAAGLAAGLSIADAAALANAAAGVVVGKVGTAVLRRPELVAAWHGRDLLTSESGKLSDLADLIETVQRWRRQGFRVGFTNGCFDLLHPGHVALLRQARAACDRLIVALNSDSSVRRLKGSERPVQSEAARASVLASLAPVDRLVIFSEDTPLALIEALKPDLLVKGADYSRDQVVGADVVERAGGEVLLVALEDGHSTSATLARLARDAQG